MEKDKKRTFKRRSYIAFRYIKHYSPWALLLIALMLTGKIVHKNYSYNDTNEVATSSFTAKQKTVETQPIVIKQVTKVPEPITKVEVKSTELEISKIEELQQQLIEEKKRNLHLESSLSNQEQQLVSALDEITQSYKSKISDDQLSKSSPVNNNSSLKQPDYYQKVKNALENATSPSASLENNPLKKVSVSETKDQLFDPLNEG